MALQNAFPLRDSSNHLLSINFWVPISAADPTFLPRRLRSLAFNHLLDSQFTSSNSEPHLDIHEKSGIIRSSSGPEAFILEDFLPETAQVNFFQSTLTAMLV
ncbi:MAG: hypothetical protein AAF587_44490 [Bacteroidota bacterium]